MKITYHLAASRDGYIAKENGDVSWLEEYPLEGAESGLVDFFEGIDGLVMGRRTYEFVFEYGTWPYEDRPCWVVTHSGFETMPGARLFHAEDIDNVISMAASMGMEHLWLVGGGVLASSFLDQGLISQINVTELPVDLGAGIPMFASHQLSEITCLNRVVHKKTGYRNIVVEIAEHVE